MRWATGCSLVPRYIRPNTYSHVRGASDSEAHGPNLTTLYAGPVTRLSILTSLTSE